VTGRAKQSKAKQKKAKKSRKPKAVQRQFRRPRFLARFFRFFFIFFFFFVVVSFWMLLGVYTR